MRQIDRPNFCRCASEGFTLLELLVVIVIIGLLAGLVVPRYFDTVSKSKVKIVRAQMASLEKALDQYQLDVGTLPTVQQGLGALMTQPAGELNWKGPYLRPSILRNDPWQGRFIYLNPGSHNATKFDLYSRGPNQIDGDNDDIDNWK